jgi:hypothetical protein
MIDDMQRHRQTSYGILATHHHGIPPNIKTMLAMVIEGRPR